MLHVTNAKHVGGYRIWIEFSNGDSGVADLESDLWGPMFESLRDPERFKNFSVSDVLHTLVWENGADLAPEHLHEKATGGLLESSGQTRRQESSGNRP
ncbi:MAG: DUF2442 domain-containing protein [Planctomycetes bacterium]|jgi:hypothetical protein|nr:DUF2442 domain-containing protein [Planctomycetota bacterium]